MQQKSRNMKHRNEKLENKVSSTNPRKLFERTPTLFADKELSSSSKRKTCQDFSCNES